MVYNVNVLIVILIEGVSARCLYCSIFPSAIGKDVGRDTLTYANSLFLFKLCPLILAPIGRSWWQQLLLRSLPKVVFIV